MSATARISAFLLGLVLAAPLLAQTDPIKIFGLVELSGTGATSGTNFNDGVKLAVKEINASGGILGRKIEYTANDTQSQPAIAKALAVKAIDDGAYVVMGPVFSGSIMVSMAETRRAEIPNFTGGEGSAITQQGNPYIFRTSFTQTNAMPKVARYLADSVKAKTVAMIWVNNDFGKGGRDAFMKAIEARGIKLVADISSDPGQLDFSGAVLKAKQANGDAANGAVAHVGLTADAPSPGIKAFAANFQKEYNYKPDHNGLKGYTAIYIVKAVTEKVGKLDPKAFANAMHGIKLSAKQYPGILMDVSFDKNGDLDRESFMTKVVNGKQEVVATLPPASAQ